MKKNSKRNISNKELLGQLSDWCNGRLSR